MLNFPSSPTLNQVYTSGGLSWTWDSVKWKGSGAGVTEINYMSPVTSGSVIVLADNRSVYIDNSATLATLTIRLPTGTTNASIEICFRNPVTALTITNASSVAVTGAPVNAYGPGSALVFSFLASTSNWVYWK